MPETVHIIVESGPNQGMSITVPPDGARLGRSSKNDITLVDPLLSRHHCRFFFKTGGGLCVSDLGSANHTMVNGKTVQEVSLSPNDKIEIGDTILRVRNNGITEATNLPNEKPVVDLGFSPESKKKPTKKKIGKWPLIVLAFFVVAIALGVWLQDIIPFDTGLDPDASTIPQQKDVTLTVHYEKVKANTNNIFRYNMIIEPDRSLYVEIDDLRDTRHVKKRGELDREYVNDLAESIFETGFFSLDDEYEGLQPGIHEQWDLSVTIGKDTKRTVVRNRLEPPIFEEVRQMLEECAKNELGIWAMQFTQTELKNMARKAYLQGKKLYDERAVAAGNLAKAIKSLKEADMYLETVEQKPEFYQDLIVILEDSVSMLEKKHEDQKFRIQKARRQGDWEEAADELRILLRMIPDRDDSRHKEARKQLIEVERRLSIKD